MRDHDADDHLSEAYEALKRAALDLGGGGRGPRDRRRDDDEPRGLRELMDFLVKLHDLTTRRLTALEEENDMLRWRVRALETLAEEAGK